MSSTKLSELKALLHSYADPDKGKLLSRFFKTGKGEYAEGDRFIGVTVPNTRKVAKAFRNLGVDDITALLHSPIHEERQIALFILVEQFNKADEINKKKIFKLYLYNTAYINNWDLVDLTAPRIVGGYLADKSDRKILYSLAKSKNLFEKRIAILATLYFIVKQQDYKDTFAISEMLMHEKHDLIHKAVGWMLREVGKRISQPAEEDFLKKHYKTMPRTALRYAIERFEEGKRRKYIEGKI